MENQSRFDWARLQTWVQLDPQWQVLEMVGDESIVGPDFASFGTQVTMVYPTAEKARTAEKSAAEQGFTNISIDILDPGNLPYRDGSFDLLICRHMTHMLPDVETWLAGAVRILLPGGFLIFMDSISTGSHLRGKKGRQLREAEHYLNAFARLRDPHHKDLLSKKSWEELLDGAGFEIQHIETRPIIVEFDTWANSVPLTNNDRLRLRVMLLQAPEKVLEVLTPQFTGDRIQFRLPEITILARSASNME